MRTKLYKYIPILAEHFDDIHYSRFDDYEDLRFKTNDGSRLSVIVNDDLVEEDDDCYVVYDDLEDTKGSISGVMSLFEAYIFHQKLTTSEGKHYAD